jgi:hypothetical protein
MIGRITRIFLAIIALLAAPALVSAALISTDINYNRYFDSPVYDHALVSNETNYAHPHNPMTQTAGDLGIVELYQDAHWQHLGDWNAVIKAMSDHQPIWFLVDYMAEERD